MSDDNKGFDPDYDDRKEPNVLYIGKKHKNADGSSYRQVEIIIEQKENYVSDKNKSQGSIPMVFSIKDGVILNQSPGGQQKIHCWLMESEGTKTINAIHISRRTKKGVYGSQEITLTHPEVIVLKKYIDNLFFIDTSNVATFKIPVADLKCDVAKPFSRIITDEEFGELIKENIRSTDDFYKLLSLQKMELATEKLRQIIGGDFKNEVAIQKFLKNNLWMFGNDYVYLVQDNQINAANILDMIPQNIESYIDIIEVKLPTEKLFNFDNSHKNYYPTADVTKAIAQVQNYIYELERKANDIKYQQANNCRIIRPRGIILIGSDKDLDTDEKKYLRILNASYHNILILTYQQLLEKASNTISLRSFLP